MKNLVILIISIALLSCDNENYIVKLPNGSLLPVKRADGVNIDYPIGTKVCVKQTAGTNPNWYICTDGELKDTTYFNQYSDSTISIVDHKIGVINTFYFPAHP